MNFSKERRILGDHKQVGRKFFPPMASLLTRGGEMSWVERILPELLWLALLDRAHGPRAGADLALRVAGASRASARRHAKRWFAPLSFFLSLNTRNWGRIRQDLVASGDLFAVQFALRPLLLYDRCPMAGLFGRNAQRGNPDDVTVLRAVVASLLDKTSPEAVRTHAFAIYIMRVAGLLPINPDGPFARFPHIQHYPHTEESQALASLARAHLLAIFAAYEIPAEWATSFWDQNLILTSCNYASLVTA